MYAPRRVFNKAGRNAFVRWNDEFPHDLGACPSGHFEYVA